MASFKGRFRVTLIVAVLTGLLTGAYLLVQFSSYETKVTNLINGKHKNLILGQLVEAKLKAAEELIDISVSSEEANKSFRDKIKDAAEGLKNLELEDVRKQAVALVGATGAEIDASADKDKASNQKAASDEGSEKFNQDLFVSHRNLKSAAFNLYRNSWSNKWMSVAKTMGLIINDLDNTPYHSASSVTSGIYSKIVSITAYVTNTNVSQSTKLYILGQLSFLKQRVTQYDDQIKAAQKAKEERRQGLEKVLAQVKQYNEKHAKSFRMFNDEARSDLFKAIIGFLCSILFSMFWYFASSKKLNERVLSIITDIKKQFSEWISPNGSFTFDELKTPEDTEKEFRSLYKQLNTVTGRLYSLRREELLIKRLLNVPFVLINQSKQAVYWNSALCILSKVRALEELGTTAYQNLLKMTDGKGTLIDPVSRCFLEKREISQLSLLRVAQDSIACLTSCLPVFSTESGREREIEYVMVHLRDLREENRRTEREIDNQLGWIKQLLEELTKNSIASAPKFSQALTAKIKTKPENISKTAEQITALLHEYAKELESKAESLNMQVENLSQTVEKEMQIKQAIAARTEELGKGMNVVVQSSKKLLERENKLTDRADSLLRQAKEMVSFNEKITHSNSDIVESFHTLKGHLEQLQHEVRNITGLNSRTREEEKDLKAMLQNTLLLNINNSILAGKDDLTPMDVAAFSDYVGQIIRQFDRSISIFEKSIDEVDALTKSLVTRVENGIQRCESVLVSEEQIQKVLSQTDRVLKSAVESFKYFHVQFERVTADAGNLNTKVNETASKVGRMVQIGQSSLNLQEHLIRAFKELRKSIGSNRLTLDSQKATIDLKDIA